MRVAATEWSDAMLIPDLLRGLAVAGAGAVFAMALSEAYLYTKRYKDKRDPWYGITRLLYMRRIRYGVALMSIFLIGAVLGRIGDDMTWRTPAALLIEFLLISGMYGILRDDEVIQDGGLTHHAKRKTDPIE